MIKRNHIALLLLSALTSIAHASDSDRFITNGNLDWKPKESAAMPGDSPFSLDTYISKDGKNLVDPIPCKYLPVKSKLAKGLFYVESKDYSIEETVMLETTCKSGMRAIDIISKAPASDGSSLGKTISNWIKHYSSANKFYVRESGWLARSEMNGSMTVKRTIWLYDEDPDFDTKEITPKDPFLSMYEDSDEDWIATQFLTFEWELSPEGEIIPISDFAKKITGNIAGRSFGKL